MPERKGNKKDVRALFICTMEAKRKGVEAVLKAAPALRGKVKLVFVAASQELMERVKKMGLDDVIELHQSVSRDVMRDRFYRESEIFLIPSHSEGFPNSMLEAMAAGLPVVGSPAGAIPEVITEGVNGFLNPAGDAEGLERDILKLAADPGLRKKMGQANLDLIHRAYEINTVFSMFDQVWTKAISED